MKYKFELNDDDDLIVITAYVKLKNKHKTLANPELRPPDNAKGSTTDPKTFWDENF